MDMLGNITQAEKAQIAKMTRTLSQETGKLFNRSSLRNWADVSRINVLPSETSRIKSGKSSIWGQLGLTGGKEFFSTQNVPYFTTSEDSLLEERIPVNITKLMNEGQLWCCFYNFPELYSDAYSPTVRVLQQDDVNELVNGILTRDMVATCLTYPKRTPILGDFVYIKLNLTGKHLQNIDILQHYRYLVYLDLSSNLLTDLSALSYLLYLQFLSVAFNRLNTVLNYSTPQWFLTEVHYKYNVVKKIRDLDMFWSITILDLSHNNIKYISGLENLRYLRHLDLSFNHIQRFEKLNHLRLLWLDLSYNNISTFEFSATAGLWTLLDLQYLNLNENSLKSLQLFSGCTRLREIHIRNNRLSNLLELAVYMRQCRRLIVLDMRANPVCSSPGYQDVVYDTFPLLLNLDAMEIDPEHQRASLMDTMPDVRTFASRRLLRMLYVEQLRRARVSPLVPPADTREVPLVVLVGTEGSGKGTLARRLAAECSKVQLALQHTTAKFHYPDHYKEISRHKFDDMLLAGDFLTYSEMDGESYGLSREEAFICDGKVRVCSMDLVSALMLKLRGRRPFLILASVSDKQVQARIQKDRKDVRNTAGSRHDSMGPPHERSTLQVMLSGRIIITGILNEILMALPEEKKQSEFLIESECSLFMDSDARKAGYDYARGAELLNLITSSSSSLDSARRRSTDPNNISMYSLYKESQNEVDYAASSRGQSSYVVPTNSSKLSPLKNKNSEPIKKNDKESGQKSYDFSKYTTSTWKGTDKGAAADSMKSSKSVTFTSQSQDPTGLMIEGPTKAQDQDINSHPKTSFGFVHLSPELLCDSNRHYPNPGYFNTSWHSSSAAEQRWKGAKSVSAKLLPCPSSAAVRSSSPAQDAFDDFDLWLAFLVNNGVLQHSDTGTQSDVSNNWSVRHNTKMDDPSGIIRQMGYYVKTHHGSVTTTLKDDYESIHHLLPGLFWDTITMDDPDAAFRKAKRIIKDIVERQSLSQPMFDIDFANHKNYPTVKKRLSEIRQEIAPHRVFN